MSDELLNDNNINVTYIHLTQFSVDMHFMPCYVWAKFSFESYSVFHDSKCYRVISTTFYSKYLFLNENIVFFFCMFNPNNMLLRIDLR